MEFYELGVRRQTGDHFKKTMSFFFFFSARFFSFYTVTHTIAPSEAPEMVFIHNSMELNGARV